MKMRCASFFAGVGGIDIAFEQAGFEIVYANELDKFAVETFKANHKTFIDHRSITDVQAKDIPDFDIMLAGFPCQAFSVAGYRKGFEDKGRGDLYFELERIFLEKKPKVIFLENVKNLVSHDHGRTFEIIKKSLMDNGYHIKHQVLNASEYGNIPQNRERIYVVCFQDEQAMKKFQFPEKIELTATLQDMLEDENTIDKKYFYTEKTPFFDKLVEEIKDANMGTGGHNVPLLNIQGKKDTIRKLTPRECFNFQGYPRDFVLPNISNANLYKQAGNSVVVPVIRRIAEQIKKVI